MTENITSAEEYAARSWWGIGGRAIHLIHLHRDTARYRDGRPRHAGHSSTLHIHVGRRWLDRMRPEYLLIDGLRTLVYTGTARTDARGYTTMLAACSYRLTSVVVSPSGEGYHHERPLCEYLPPHALSVTRRSAIAEARASLARRRRA